MSYEDILYDRDDTGVVTITINRPDKLNAFRTQTVDELVDAFRTAWADRGCGVVVLSGAGDRAEIWYLCRQYSATEAYEMGMVNAVVPLAELEEETVRWCSEILEKSPLAIRLLKAAFNAAADGLAGQQQLAGDATLLFYMTEEAQEGRNAFNEKRKPEFGKFPRLP